VKIDPKNALRDHAGPAAKKTNSKPDPPRRCHSQESAKKTSRWRLPEEPGTTSRRGLFAMDYEFTTGAPITEQEALEQVAAMGFYGLAFDDAHDEDEILHWHEFSAVTWVISGSGSVENEDGKVFDLGPGCRLQAPAGYLHRALAGTNARLVIGTDLPSSEWTGPLNKKPADRPAALSS
jgi:mannose-6-phosphate isomerase-like protein (cupin superfamily)